MKVRILIAFSIVFLLWLASWYLLTRYVVEWTVRGTFGDMVGAVNALFSGLAFAGIIVALIFQKEELALQRQELRDTREELKGQREQMELQNASIKKQLFENTFFQMLRLHHEIVNSYNIIKKTYPTKIETVGRECFKDFYNDFRKVYSQEASKTDTQDLSFVDSIYVKFYEQHLSDLPHYFRNLLSIIEFVREAHVSNQRFYTDLVRAQLSTYEQLILFYHCLSRYGEEMFKPLVIEFQLLSGMSENLLKESFHRQYYPEEAM